jgi:hypothetical protein
MAKSNSNAAAVKGQKNLFSFFSKKPATTAASTAASATKEGSLKSTNNSAAVGAPSKNSSNDTSVTQQKQQQQSDDHQNPTISRTTSNNNNQQQPLSSQLNKLLGKVTVGTKLAVYWPDDQEYYPCLVTRHRVKTSVAGGGEGEYMVSIICLSCYFSIGIVMSFFTSPLSLLI